MDLLKSIDIALGMIVIYLTFSLCVTALNEVLAASLSSRATWLRRGIAALLTPAAQDEVAPDASADAFYRSPFISYLGRAAGWQPRFAPSYIPRWTMLQGLLDTAQEKKGQALDTLQSIRAAAERLPENSPARVAVLDMLARADQNMDRFKTLVDEWLAIFEEQVRSWYRQKTQFVLLLLSGAVVVAMNLDTIALFKQLTVDTKTRNALVQRALDQASAEGLDKLVDQRSLKAAQQQATRLTAASAPKTEIEAAEAKVDAERVKVEQASTQLVAGLTTDGLRLGWSKTQMAGTEADDWILKLFGLLLSAGALSMGAPFWFDLLQKVASVRAVGLNLAERAKRSDSVPASNQEK